MRKGFTTLLVVALALGWAAGVRGESGRQTAEQAIPAPVDERPLQGLQEYRLAGSTYYEGVGTSLVDVSLSNDELVRRLRESVATFQDRQRASHEQSFGQIAGRDAQEAGTADRPAQLDSPSSLVERSYCGSSVVNLCLLGRFSIAAEFSNPYLGPQIYLAGAYQLTLESGYMWWEGPTVMEVPIKVLNFCGSERVFKVFAAGLTNFYVRIVILDAATGMAVEIRNPAYQIFNTQIGTLPFPC